MFAAFPRLSTFNLFYRIGGRYAERSARTEVKPFHCQNSPVLKLLQRTSRENGANEETS